MEVIKRVRQYSKIRYQDNEIISPSFLTGERGGGLTSRRMKDTSEQSREPLSIIPGVETFRERLRKAEF